MPKLDAKTRLKRFETKNSWQAFLQFVQVFWFFVKYLRRHKAKALLMMVASSLAGPIWLINGIILKILIDDSVLASGVPTTERLQVFWICFWALAVWYVLYILVKEVIPGLVGWYLDVRIALDLMRDMYVHELSMEIAFHRKRAIGEHMYRTAEDVTSGSDLEQLMEQGTIVSLITDDWMQIVAVMSQLVVATWLFFEVEPAIGILVGLYLLIKLPTIHITTTWGNRIELEWREVSQERFAVERDIVAGLKTFKTLGRTRRAFHRYVQMLLRTQEIYYKLAVIKHWFINKFILKFVLQVFLWERMIKLYVYVRILQGAMTLGDLALVTILAGQLQAPITRFVELIQRFRKAMVPARRLYETISLTPAIQDKPGAPSIGVLEGRFALENVTFNYGEGPNILTNVSLQVEPGERVAFVGPSGAGKSTVFKLLLRLYDPITGRVLLDGKDIRDYRLKSVLDQVGVIMQDTHIFSGSIRENVRLGDMYASQDKINWAIDQAELREMVDNAPDGLDTFLGEGTKLSGGQKQRIGIARALMRKPKLFIMDEPTAHVDVIVETRLLNTIERVSRGITTLVISHRISPILFVDKIIVLTPGGVEAAGTHAELLTISPTYRTLWTQQNKGAA